MQVTSSINTEPIPGAYWEWGDRAIYYVRAGDRRPDRPPLLLIHGFGASTDHWRKTIAGLQTEFEVWAIDLLGFGRSAKPNCIYSGELWRDQLQDFIQTHIGKPTVVVGNSLGGYAALCLGAQCPESVAGVVLLNSAGPFTDTEPRPEPPFYRKALNTALKAAFRQNWVSFLLFQWTRRRATIRKTLMKVYLDPSAVTDQLVEEIYRPSCDRGAAQVFASIFKTPPGEKVDRLLSQLKAPLLTLWGEGDPWMKIQERSEQFRQYYPEVTEYFLKAGHCPHDEIPDRVNELIRDWVLSQVR